MGRSEPEARTATALGEPQDQLDVVGPTSTPPTPDSSAAVGSARLDAPLVEYATAWCIGHGLLDRATRDHGGQERGSELIKPATAG